MKRFGLTTLYFFAGFAFGDPKQNPELAELRMLLTENWVIHNNLQNISVPAFKPTRLDRRTKSFYVDLSQGAIKKTENPLDFALTGDGFFKIVESNGNEYLTRDGRFQDFTGALTVAGCALSPKIDLSHVRRSDLVFEKNRLINKKNQEIVYQFKVYRSVKAFPATNCTYVFSSPDTASCIELDPDSIDLVQGYIEQPTVNPVVESAFLERNTSEIKQLLIALRKKNSKSLTFLDSIEVQINGQISLLRGIDFFSKKISDTSFWILEKDPDLKFYKKHSHDSYLWSLKSLLDECQTTFFPPTSVSHKRLDTPDL